MQATGALVCYKSNPMRWVLGNGFIGICIVFVLGAMLECFSFVSCSSLLFFGIVLVVLLHCVSFHFVVLLFVMLYIVVRSAMLIRKVYAGFVVVLLLVVGISLRP